MVDAAEPGSIPVPASVMALRGCWNGSGNAMGKPVTMNLVARPVALDAMFAIDASSQTIGDPKDQYAAHLLFGGAKPVAGETGERVFGFWADSFGGTATVVGEGTSSGDSFEVIYRYPDTVFRNRWDLDGDILHWTITVSQGAGDEKPFASYSLRRARCRR